ncbi:MAG: SdrD B-like domain-containing protein, partial [Flectobacillus sp.]|nr:SdrD B-like domain-containing protein [Flectobacillus sp.]
MKKDYKSQTSFKKLIAVFCMLFLSYASAYAQTCTLSLTNIKVSNCYQLSGQSKASISFEVNWTNAPTGDSIKVVVGTQTRYFKVGSVSVSYPQPDGTVAVGSRTIVTPQLIGFEVPADGATGNIQASFANNSSCSVLGTYLASASCQPISCASLSNAVGGIVFKDFNSDGVKNAGETSGVSGINVTATSFNGTVYTTTTDVLGTYGISIPAAAYPVRVEFSGLGTVFKSAFNGASSATSIQFISSPSCNVNFGVSTSGDYCGASKDISVFIPCFVNGDPLVAGTAASSDALVSFPYGLSDSLYTRIVHNATAQNIGTVWGLAYQKTIKKLFAAATLKRHAGLGALGLGGIYTVNSSNTVSPFIDVATIGINVGTIPNNTSRG